jgi:hypothetical protein
MFNKKNKGDKGMKTWKPKYQKGATYLSKVDGKKYFINCIYAKRGGIGTIILEDNVSLDKNFESFNRSKDNQNRHYGFSQPQLKKLNLVKTNDPILYKISDSEFYAKHKRLPTENDIEWREERI